jgi:hypothetical protein
MRSVCTVVVHRDRNTPVQVLALRDELVGREFDDPGKWWPEYPGVVGGRDRSAGGTWCAVDLTTGVTALVLNRPQKRVADAGAPSRGVLPLLGAQHGADWLSRIELSGMASFLLVLATPERLASWTFDGTDLVATEHGAGTSMFTSGFEEDGKVDRYLPAFRSSSYPDGWRAVVAAETPADDPAALLVRHEGEGFVFATVFGQLFQAEPGRLDLCYTRRPDADDEPWQTVQYGQG